MAEMLQFLTDLVNHVDTVLLVSAPNSTPSTQTGAASSPTLLPDEQMLLALALQRGRKRHSHGSTACYPDSRFSEEKVAGQRWPGSSHLDHASPSPVSDIEQVGE